MAVEIWRTFHVQNSNGWRFEISEDTGGAEIRYFELEDQSPRRTLYLSGEDLVAIFTCLSELVELDEPVETDE